MSPALPTAELHEDIVEKMTTAYGQGGAKINALTVYGGGRISIRDGYILVHDFSREFGALHDPMIAVAALTTTAVETGANTVAPVPLAQGVSTQACQRGGLADPFSGVHGVSQSLIQLNDAGRCTGLV